VWEATGGAVMISGDFRHVWRQLTRIFGVVDPTPEGASLDEKIRLRREAAAQWFAGRPDRETLIADIERAGLAWGPVRSTGEALDSPTARSRGLVAELDDRGGGVRRVIQSPYRFSAAESGLRGVAPYRGEHNRTVLDEWLGLPAAEVEALEERGVLLAEELPA
jgi:crotonobetainyl-CoA:carnitine CoA-transferase CaiB-like acyl-CoA transferase